ncbi:MAG: GatB/YqeY domain-containing protein [Thermodesulfobacteriota bacterium]|nr:GatB/YqeY domain-containing protein [Thermodesulfobacteriota bacterium]
MSLNDKLVDEMKQAAKAKDKLRLSTIRMIRASIKNKEIEKKKELDDKEIIETISTLVKQRKESITQFRQGKRDDLVRKEEAELEILLSFMPKQLSREEIEAEVMKAIQETEAESVRDIGKVMKILMADLAGKADGRVVNEIVRERLSN